MIRRIATILAATSAFVMLVAGTAAADDMLVYAPNGEIEQAGSAKWTENGDLLTVCDREADGYGVRGYIYRPYAEDYGNGTVLVKANDPSFGSGCTAVSTNISEVIPIAIKVCMYKGDWVGYCRWRSIIR